MLAGSCTPLTLPFQPLSMVRFMLPFHCSVSILDVTWGTRTRLLRMRNASYMSTVIETLTMNSWALRSDFNLLKCRCEAVDRSFMTDPINKYRRLYPSGGVDSTRLKKCAYIGHSVLPMLNARCSIRVE